MTTRLLFSALAAMALGGCSMSLPLRGQMQNGDETFSGVATGYLDGAGHLRLVSSKGTVCTGNFVYTSSRTGEGVAVCDDKRSGPFSFVSTGSRGTGTGTLGGERFI